VAYSYDLGGNRLEVKLDGQVFVTYAYDDASRLTSITRGSNVFGFGYDNANRRTSMSYPNGVDTSYSYDSLSRLTNLSAVKNPTTITNFTYTYDNAGNRLTKQQLDYSESYSYDKLYRLTGVDRTGGSSGRWLYSYDAVGNRLSEQINDAVSSSTYNVKNQLLSTAGGGPLRWRGTLNEPGNVAFTSVLVNGQPARMLVGNVFEAILQMTAGNNTVTVQATDVSGNVTTKSYQVNVTSSGTTYSYDLNGNLTQKVEGADTWGYEWNAQNQLTRVTKNSLEQTRFKYDPRGRRVEKVAGGLTITWTYDAEVELTRFRRQPSYAATVPAACCLS
jgi:YD repeat-containing protein